MSDPVGDLRKVLEVLRSKLLSGNLSGLDTSLDTLVRVEASLRSGNLSQDDLIAVRSLARQVAGLLEASAKGVRSAVRRMTDLAGQDPQFAPYGADGRREVAIAVPPKGRRA